MKPDGRWLTQPLLRSRFAPQINGPDNLDQPLALISKEFFDHRATWEFDLSELMLVQVT
jgi:hypothetical protein